VTDIEESVLPPNARLDAIVFDDAAPVLRVVLRGETAERTVQPAIIAAVFGGRIRHETTAIVSASEGGINFGKVAFTMATGLPVGIRKSSPKTKVAPGEELHYALAMRLDGVPELWYLLAASFNFRKALGPESTYSMETNLRAFVKRLAAFAPGAVQDAFFAAMIGGSPLPPPVESLLDFFRLASAR
jgi:hypothetical protein